MSELLQTILTILATMLGTGGIGSIFYIRLHKKLKEAEVKGAEIQNESSINDEWEDLCKSLKEEREQLVAEIKSQHEIIKGLRERIDKMAESKEDAWGAYSKAKIENAKKDRTISELNWYRCEINGCPYRKPPRKFGDMDFPTGAKNPETHPDPNSL